MALQWLGRREYSRRELHDKLMHKGCAPTLAAEVVAALERERLLSDDRFVESLVRARRNRGYGPLRIRNELQEKGVAPEAIDESIDVGDQAWLEDLRRVQRKKFGAARPKSPAERARQTRFLHYRGFTYDQIQKLFDPREPD